MRYLLYPFDGVNSIGSSTVFAESILMIRQLGFIPISKSAKDDVYGELTHSRANTDTPVFRGVTFGSLPFPVSSNGSFPKIQGGQGFPKDWPLYVGLLESLIG